MTYEDIVTDVATQLNMPKKLIDRTYRAFWKAVRLYITSLPLKEALSDEEFLKLKPNVNIPSIGKLYVNLDRYHGMKKYFETHYRNYKGNKYKKDNNAEN